MLTFKSRCASQFSDIVVIAQPCGIASEPMIFSEADEVRKTIVSSRPERDVLVSISSHFTNTEKHQIN